ncbi:hypothetical protein [Halobacillus dabanensis]|uniref:hypothetical protein n=1 Tax=Halobacillus dabanensis TaxID=240302 RepID=UPI001428CCE5|nr:hypothetical protein [Halobacillus dabanensis]
MIVNNTGAAIEYMSGNVVIRKPVLPGLMPESPDIKSDVPPIIGSAIPTTSEAIYNK